jgi:fructose-specific component phosphotransferase system IIB-like protein
MTTTADALCRRLALADPETARQLNAALKDFPAPIAAATAEWLLPDVIWGLSHETVLGRTIGLGYCRLIRAAAPPDQVAAYHRLVRDFGQKGPAVGTILAEHLARVLVVGDPGFQDRFLTTVGIMLAQGPFTLKGPLEGLARLLAAADHDSADVYLGLLRDTFSQELTYGECQRFAIALPKALQAFTPQKRRWQLQQLRRVVRTTFRLAEPYLEGFARKLHLLSETALNRFVSQGLEKAARNEPLAARYLALEADAAVNDFATLQVAVPLSQVQGRLSRYLRARTGLPIAIRPLSALAGRLADGGAEPPLVCSDGKAIFLPDEISRFSSQAANLELFKSLTRLEAAAHEFGTYGFDLEKLRDLLAPRSLQPPLAAALKVRAGGASDLERFLAAFPSAFMAADLFTVFEHGRLRLALAAAYPGLARKTLPLLQEEARRLARTTSGGARLDALYARVALGIEAAGAGDATVERLAEMFAREITAESPVAAVGALVLATYALASGSPAPTPAAGGTAPEAPPRLRTPFGRRVRPDLFFRAHAQFDASARKIQARLAEKGVRVYTSDVAAKLAAQNGRLSTEDLSSLILGPPGAGQAENAATDFSWLDLADILGGEVIPEADADAGGWPVAWYWEWDEGLGDYLHDHTRVIDRTIAGREGDFYGRTLTRCRGLVRRVRHCFELLKPEGLKLLRPWVEGDEFDYRAMLDFAIDRKIGLMPSERLYIKRIKQQRDVAVLLLVDLSRSTANTVYGSQATVLSVEQEAIVLFCEALAVVGDAFAIAGFSGTGRLGVDYYRIKDFDEALTESVRRRINAMAPQRSTRMGAAIRHATHQLAQVPARVRLLIILGDGFPNDVNYKKAYAIADTRRAIFEARSRAIHTHAITVNLAADPKLDALYGNVHHNVISDVRELPDKLLRIYSALTRI